MRIPTIHLNGTGKETLISGYHEAYDALRKVENALSDIEFNPRDYYVQGPDAWPEAVKEMDSRKLKIYEVKKEIEDILIALE